MKNEMIINEMITLYNWEILVPIWDQSQLSGLFPNLFLIQLFTSVYTSNKAEPRDSPTYFHFAVVP